MQEIPVVSGNPAALRASLIKSEYDINHPADVEFIRDLGKTCPAELPVKKPLKLIVMGKAGEEYYFQSGPRLSRELQDAIIRFNNSALSFTLS